MKRFTSSRGITLFEVALLLTLTSAFAAALTPTLSATISDARAVRAGLDMNQIRDAINFFKGSGFTFFTTNGSQTPANRVNYLFGDGDIPEVGATAFWRLTTAGATEDFLEQHLVLNSVGYSLAVAPIWRGAYINSPADPDPWGNRYAVNVIHIGNGATLDDTVVHSAGPDENVDTNVVGNGLVAGQDDIIVLVEA